MKFIRFLQNVLTVIFWGLLIFGFDSAYVAFLTLICTVIHESGHILFLRIFNAKNYSHPKGALNGLRIRRTKLLSYKKEALISFGGALSNLIVGLILLLLFKSSDYLFTFGVLNIMTAVSNLLPIEGYDGYKILSSILHCTNIKIDFERLLISVSFCFCTLLTFFGLFMILILGEGFWIFAIFFTSFISSLRKRKKYTFYENS